MDPFDYPADVTPSALSEAQALYDTFEDEVLLLDAHDKESRVVTTPGGISIAIETTAAGSRYQPVTVNDLPR